MMEPEFLERWRQECLEWDALAEEMIAAAGEKSVCAYDVSVELKARQLARGDKPIDWARVRLVPP